MKAMPGAIRAVTLSAILTLAGVAAAQTPQPVADKEEGKICKRFAPSGSLIKSRRECRTKAEWDRMAEAAQSVAADTVERGRGRPSGM